MTPRCTGRGAAALRRVLLGAALVAVSGVPCRDAAAQAAPSAGMAFGTAAPLQPEIRAQLSAVHSTVISSEMAGRIEELAVRDGDRFQSGTVLIAFGCGVYHSRLAKAEAILRRTGKLLEIKERLERLESVGRADLEIARADRAEAAAEVDEMRSLVRRCTIRAPFPGIVADLKVRRFQSVREGDPLLAILDDRSLEVEAIMPAHWLAFLKPGFPFSVHLEGLGREVRVAVDRLSGQVDPVSQSIKVYARILDDTKGLMAGLSGRAQVTVPGAAADADRSGGPRSR